MCHLMLFIPVLALPIFWLVPLNLSLPLYLIILLVSGLLYWFVYRAMIKRPETGAESLVGVEAEVVSRLRPVDHAQYLVRSGGELWSADSAEALQPGEVVKVAALDGIKLVVRRKD